MRKASAKLKHCKALSRRGGAGGWDETKLTPSKLYEHSGERSSLRSEPYALPPGCLVRMTRQPSSELEPEKSLSPNLSEERGISSYGSSLRLRFGKPENQCVKDQPYLHKHGGSEDAQIWGARPGGSGGRSNPPFDSRSEQLYIST